MPSLVAYAAESVNPMTPAIIDWVFFAAGLVAVGLAALALISVARNRMMISSTALAVWILAIVLVPVVASLSWFAIGRPVANSAGTT